MPQLHHRIAAKRSLATPWFIAVTAICLITSLRTTNAQLIEGEVEKCSVEGKRAHIPLISNMPCLSCVCKSGLVQCKRQECTESESCSVLIHREGECCRTCQGCTLHGRVHQALTAWKQFDNEGNCMEHVCQDGIITRSRKQCHAPCSTAVTTATQDSCECPSCEGCEVGGVVYPEGEEVQSDPCTTCLCTNGRLQCWKKTCPVLACEQNRRIVMPGQCCPKCAGQRRVFELREGKCWFQRTILENSEKVQLDKCTSCQCQDGTVICNREVCPATTSCLEEEHIYSEDMCCPHCPTDIPRNCTSETGEQLQHGDEWDGAKDPCLACRCENSNVTCTKKQCPNQVQRCPQGQMLDKKAGDCCLSCVPEPGICAVFGDPHYRTFDGRPFNFQGSCKYVLAKDCMGESFSIIAENHSKQSKEFSWTNNILMKILDKGSPNETTISLHQRLIVKVNDRKVSLPYVGNEFLAWEEHHILKVRTNAGISLNWDGDSFLEIGASVQHRGMLCGLCGNFNGFPRDDFIGGDGMFKSDEDDFAESWQVGDKDCSRPEHSTRAVSPCGKNVKLKKKARKTCKIFKTREFQNCYSQVDPTDYYKSCLTDSCECPRNKRCACESIRAYASACAHRGVKITWDENQHCKGTCGKGQVFSTCSSPCKMTCKNYKRLRRRNTCRRTCVAGCHCATGHVLHEGKCVKANTCRGALFPRVFRKSPLDYFLNGGMAKAKAKRQRQRRRRQNQRRRKGNRKTSL